MATVLAERRSASLTTNYKQEWRFFLPTRLGAATLALIITAALCPSPRHGRSHHKLRSRCHHRPLPPGQLQTDFGIRRPQKEVPSEYSYALLLDTGDLLDIRVFDTPDLSEKLRVDNRGDITLPVGGIVKVRGLTAEQAQTAIEERFRQRNILHDPHVEVFVLEYATQGVTVAGEVKLPGVYAWSGKRTVLDFVSLAGGVTPVASKTFTLTHKRTNAAIVTAELSDSSPKADVEPGDLIVVTRAGVVYVVGDVASRADT